MKKRTAFISLILSLIPFGQPLLIKSSSVLSTTVLLISLDEKVYAESANYYFDQAFEKGNNGDHYGAISDYTKAIEINPQYAKAYVNRGRSYYFVNSQGDACKDFKKAVSLGHTSTEEWLNSEGGFWCKYI